MQLPRDPGAYSPAEHGASLVTIDEHSGAVVPIDRLVGTWSG
jgi:hypothetical protein